MQFNNNISLTKTQSPYKHLATKDNESRVYNAVMCPKLADGMAKTVDSLKTSFKAQSGQSLHCLCRPICSNT